MIISVVKYTVRLYLSTDDGLVPLQTFERSDPVPDTTADGIALSFLITCGLEQGAVYYYEIDVLKRTSTGREYLVSSDGIFRPGQATQDWESACDGQADGPYDPSTLFNVIVEWDFDITQFLGNDEPALNWYYRLGDSGEWVTVNDSCRTMVTGTIEHVTLNLNRIQSGTLYIRGDAESEDYADILESIQLEKPKS